MTGLRVAIAVVAEIRIQVLALDLNLAQHYHPWYHRHCLTYCVSLVLWAFYTNIFSNANFNFLVCERAIKGLILKNFKSMKKKKTKKRRLDVFAVYT